MFGKRKEAKKKARPPGSLAQYGIFEVPETLDDLGSGFDRPDDDDEDFEAELAALTSGNEKQERQKPRPKRIPDANLDAMVKESMKDFDEEELSGDDDDPELLNELKTMIGEDASSEDEGHAEEPQEEMDEGSHVESGMEEMVKLIEQRLSLYKIAETRAKAGNESSKARRYNRGAKNLESLLAHAKAGKSVNMEDIPPELPPSATSDVAKKPAEPESTPMSVPEPKPEPSETESTSQTATSQEPATEASEAPSAEKEITVDQETLNLLKKRQQEYRIAAVAWKKSGNLQEAMAHVKIAKQFDLVIATLNQGETVDLSDMPPSPDLPSAVVKVEESTPAPAATEENATQGSEAPEPEAAPKGPEDIAGALKERLEIYRRTKTAAETEGNASKARRYGRICKQFEDAIKLHSRGKPVQLEELPTPPGFPPLAAPAPTPTPAPTPAPAAVSAPEKIEPQQPQDPPEKKAAPPVPPPRTNNQAKRQNGKSTSRIDKQMLALQQRQRELKQAALSAKKDGDTKLALDYLRQAKGIDPLIEATMSGLPVDMTSIPLSPLAKMELTASGIDSETNDSFTLISREDCMEITDGTDEQIYENLETQLLEQIKWCLSTRDHSKALGDVPGYNRWERLAHGYTRDLDMLRVRKRDKLPPPQHHYEVKTYAIVQSNTDLNDGDVEISIIRGINYSKEADTYVIFEFPHPKENQPTDRTATIKDTNNPQYDAVFPLTGIINRKSRHCQRAFKRLALTCQVWARGGFLRSDNLLGTVKVKLQHLETHCTLHDSFELMDGRKPSGGKLEVKIRLRNPILIKQTEQITDKWLTIDQ